MTTGKDREHWELVAPGLSLSEAPENSVLEWPGPLLELPGDLLFIPP